MPLPVHFISVKWHASCDAYENIRPHPDTRCLRLSPFSSARASYQNSAKQRRIHTSAHTWKRHFFHEIRLRWNWPHCDGCRLSSLMTEGGSLPRILGVGGIDRSRDSSALEEFSILEYLGVWFLFIGVLDPMLTTILIFARLWRIKKSADGGLGTFLTCVRSSASRNNLGS